MTDDYELSEREKVFEERGIADLEGIPMNMEEVMAAMEKPPAPVSSVKPEVSVHPDLLAAQERARVAKQQPPVEVIDMPEEPALSEAFEEGPSEEMKKLMVLPSEKDKAILKSRLPGIPLRVVPIPYSRDDGKIQTYVLKQLNRAQWNAAKSKAQKVAPSKPDVSLDEIFAEYIVREAVVWPQLPPHLHVTAAGLIETLFGITQQMGLFYDPTQLMNLTFAL